MRVRRDRIVASSSRRSKPVAGASAEEKRRGEALMVFFFQAEDGIRDLTVTGVQTCALPISQRQIARATPPESQGGLPPGFRLAFIQGDRQVSRDVQLSNAKHGIFDNYRYSKIGRASCRERV